MKKVLHWILSLTICQVLSFGSIAQTPCSKKKIDSSKIGLKKRLKQKNTDAYRALFYAEKWNNNIYKAKMYSLTVNINELNNKKVLLWHNKALLIYRENEIFEKYCLIISNTRDCHCKWKDFEKSFNLNRTALTCRIAQNNIFWKWAIYANLGLGTYEIKQNYSVALDYLTNYNELGSKKYENESDKKISFQKTDYELLNEKQKSGSQKVTITLQNQNNNFLKGTAILLLILTLLILYFYQNQKKYNRTIHTQSKQIREIHLQLEEKVVQRTSELMVANQDLLTKNEEIENALYLGKKQERDQIAGQLHDNLGGYLSAIRYNLMALDTEQLKSNEKKIFDNITKMINTAYDEVRYISHNIMPKDLESEGIVFCLKKLAKQLSDTRRIDFSYQGPKILKIDSKTEYELYSICLELTNNILKHAKATEGGYFIEVREGKKIIYVFDNGIGFQDSKDGFGLVNIKTKLHKINASCSFDSILPSNLKKYATVVKIEI